MLIEDVELCHDRWLENDLCSTSNWNGRNVRILDGEMETHENHFHKAHFIQDGHSMFICAKEGTTTTQSVGGSATAKADTEGKSEAKAEVHYERSSKDEKGRTESVSVKGETTVDQKGKGEVKATVSYDRTF